MSLDPLDEDRLKDLAITVSHLRNEVTELSKSIPAASQLKERLTRLDGHIRFEFDLTAQRVAYLATSQAFMFSAYTYSIVNKAGNPELVRVVTFVPILGFILSLLGLAAVLGAISVTRTLKAQRIGLRDQAETLGLGIHSCVESGTWQHKVGLLPPLVVTTGFAIGWAHVAGWFIQ